MPTMAESVDRYDAYHSALQPRCAAGAIQAAEGEFRPQADVSFYQQQFAAAFGRSASALREDFCGTAKWICHKRRWIGGGSDTGRQRIKALLTKLTALSRSPAVLTAATERLDLVLENVLNLPRDGDPVVDVVCANNFSHFGMKTAGDMTRYLQGVYRALGEQGILVIDVFGGPEAHANSVEKISHHTTVCGSDAKPAEFFYVYEQSDYQPDTSILQIHVHFEYEDGSVQTDAFTYDWRVWPLLELDACMRGVGFDDTKLFVDGYDDNNDYQHTNEELKDWRNSYVHHLEEEDYYSCFLVAYKNKSK